MNRDEAFIPELTKREGLALQAVYDGTAVADQQRLALQVIVTKFCLRYEVPHIPGKPEAATFLAGRLCVGRAIEKALMIQHSLEKDDGPES